MSIQFRNRDDFESEIRILHAAEGGRVTAARNGIRWDLCYAEDDPKDGIWMIWPDFLDSSGRSIPKENDLPVGAYIPAKMFILSDELRRDLHRRKIKVGGRFYCHEGSKRVAEGVVTKITHLHDERL